MRVCNMPFSLTSLVLTTLLSRPIVAGLIPDLLQSLEDLQDVRKRCTNSCGYYGQLCCASDEVCYTDANDQAQCGPGTAVTTTAAGEWQYYTTTFVQTDLKTVTLTTSSYCPTTTLSCSYSLGETPCGNVCCLSGQFCQAAGVCALVGGGSSGYYSSLYTVTTIITNTASAPIRPTSNTITVINTATATLPYVTPVSSDGSVIVGQQTSGGGGLSGGAIAGIVIGVIIGLILLLLFCACCLFKGLIDGLLAIFGLGPKRRRTTEEEVYIERHSHHGGRGRRTWFGARPARSEVVDEKRRKKSGLGTAGWLAAGVGGLALWLGLKRKNRRDDKSNSGSGSSYYDYSASSE